MRPRSCGQLLALGQHGGGEVDGGHLGYLGGEGHGGMPRAAAGVEHMLAASEPGCGDQLGQIRAGRVDGAGAIVRGHLAELVLDGGLDGGGSGGW